MELKVEENMQYNNYHKKEPQPLNSSSQMADNDRYRLALCNVLLICMVSKTLKTELKVYALPPG